MKNNQSYSAGNLIAKYLPLFKFLGLRLGLIVVGLTLLVVTLSRLTWSLNQGNQKRHSPRLSTVSNADLKKNVFLGEDIRADFKPLTKAEFHRLEKGVHSVGEWTKERQFNQSPLLDKKLLPLIQDRLPDNPLVIYPPDQNGPYGGIWQRYGTSAPDVGIYRARLAYDGLVRWGPMGQKILPNLAVKWEITDQGRTYIFWLRRGVRWSDGQLFSVDDILFWYHRIILNPELTPTIPREYQRDGIPMKVEKVNDYTVRFSFTSPYGLFLQAVASRRGYPMVEHPAHYLKQFHLDFVPRSKLEKMTAERSFDFWYQLFGEKAGWQNPDIPRLWPWVLKVPPPAPRILFERNPYYWKVDSDGNQLPYIDQMSFQIYDSQLINMKAMHGEVGMQGRHLQFNNFPQFKANSQNRGYVVRSWISSGGGSALAINLNHKDPILKEIFADHRFRKALSYAINRPELNEVAFFGIGQPCQISPPSISPFYSADYEKAYTEFDPVKANQLLDEMELSQRNKNGIRLRPDGRPLHLRIEIASVFLSIPMFELIARQWTEVGVQTELKVEARQLFYARKSALLHDVGVWGTADELIPVVDPRWFFPYSGESIQGIGYARWFQSNGRRGITPPPAIKKCMELYKQIERSPISKQQQQLFQQIIELNRQNLWVIGTVGRIPSIFVVKDTFRNVPKVAVSGSIFRTPGNTAPECYAIAN